MGVFQQLAAALAAVHERGIIHRNLKPKNIRITPSGHVKLVDFRLAAGIGQNQESEAVGTPAYMCPEQTRGEPLDERADVWAFGCCFYESLTGNNPFSGEMVADVKKHVLTLDPDIARLPQEVPAHLGTMIMRCLEKEPQRRLRSITDISVWLQDGTRSPQNGRGGSSNFSAIPMKHNRDSYGCQVNDEF